MNIDIGSRVNDWRSQPWSKKLQLVGVFIVRSALQRACLPELAQVPSPTHEKVPGSAKTVSWLFAYRDLEATLFSNIFQPMGMLVSAGVSRRFAVE